MPNLSITLNADIRKVNRVLRKLRTRIDKGEYLKLIGLRALEWVNEGFEQQGKEVKWKKMSPSTRKRRRKGKGRGSAKLLQDTGAMRKSAVYEVRSRAYVRVGFTDRKSVWHHYGSTKTHLPARRLMPSKKSAEGIARDVLHRYAKVLARDAIRAGR